MNMEEKIVVDTLVAYTESALKSALSMLDNGDLKRFVLYYGEAGAYAGLLDKEFRFNIEKAEGFRERFEYLDKKYAEMEVKPKKKLFGRKEKTPKVPAFSLFLKEVHSMDFGMYVRLPEQEQKRIEADYINRYNTPIKWW